MRRREFLKAATAIAALPLNTAAATVSAARKRIVIVGAGLAGLVAGYELKRRGHRVTILEARDRPGGRVHTLREPFAGGQHAEAGAMFVPSSHELVIKYARAFGLTLRPMPARALAPMLYAKGRRIDPLRPAGYDWPVELSAAERKITLDQMAEKYLGPALAELGNPRAAGWPQEKLRKYDRISLAELLRHASASPGAIELLRLNDADLVGDGVESVSALYVLRETKYYETAYQTYAIAGGSDRLPGAFAKQLGMAIQYNSPVVQIDRTGNAVLLTTRTPHGPQTIGADFVICAVPLPVLERIVFRPGLPDALRHAQSEVGYTSVTRVYAQTQDRPWEATAFGISAYTDLPSMTLVNSTYDQPGRAGILHSYATGKNARAAAALDEKSRTDAALTDMERLFPGMRKSLLRSTSIAWDEDEWSRGAFAWFRPGQMFELPRQLDQPVERIYFAGEHASSYPGWMQGALESGLRAAAEAERRSDPPRG
jgi:monoamine oxidase